MKTQIQLAVSLARRRSWLFARSIGMVAAVVLLLAVVGAGAQPAGQVIVNGHPVHPTRLLAKFKNPEHARQQPSALAATEARVRTHYRLVPGLAVLDDIEPPTAAANRSVEARRTRLLNRMESLKRTGLFEYVEVDYLVHTLVEPTDTAYVNGQLWGLKNVGQSGGVPGADISATNAWDITTGSTNVIVSVIDTGIRYTHNDLTNQMWRNLGEIPNNGIDDDGNGYIDDVFGINAITGSGNPFDDDDHGTHVAGTIGAAANDGNPHVGVAWSVQLMACKFLGPFGGTTSDGIECIDYSVTMGARILNNSWGGGGFSLALYDSIDRARQAGVLFVAAAGNSGLNNDVFPHYPSSYPLENVISVAAIDRKDELANFSNFGATSVHVGAPGVDIYSSTSGNNSEYKVFSGTSMAAPHVAGVAALVLAKYPSADLDELRGRILLSAVPTPALSGRCTTGGRVNAHNALTLTGSGILQTTVTPPSGSFLLAGSTQPIFVRVTDPFSVSDATVTGEVSGDGTFTFHNDGMPPDVTANDAIYSYDYAVPTATNPVTITITAEAPEKAGSMRVVEYIVLPPPPNDYFTNATKVPVAGGLYRANNVFATIESGEPAHHGILGVAGSLWWVWTPSSSTQVFVDTTGSWVDTVLAVYTGNSLGGLTPIASSNDVGQKKQAHLSFSAQAGVAYRIAVAGLNTNELGGVQLRVTPNGQPDTTPPNVFITAPVNGSVLGSNLVTLSGTASDPSPNATGVSEVIISVNGGLSSSASGATSWSAPVVLRAGLNTIAARAIDAAGNQSSPAIIQINYFLPGPPNDFFVNAISLNDTNALLSVTNSFATKETGEPNHAGSFGGKSVWWKFTPEADGLLTLSTLGSSFDTVMALYTDTGTNIGSLELVASNDDAGDGTHSEISHAVRAGTPYRIAVDGFDGLSGVVQLTSTFTPREVFHLTLNVSPGGTVTPISHDVASNTTVVLTATADAGREFDLWGGDVVSIANPLSVVVRSNMTVTAQFRVGGFTDDFETGNLSRLPWTFGGNAPWIVRTNVVALGQYAARSAAITHNQTSSLILTGNFRAGMGSFDYRVSSEPGFDRLGFYVNGVLLQSWSGAVGWTTYNFPLNAGTRTLEWRYSKDGSTSMGADAAYVDNVILPLLVTPTPAAAAHLELTQQSDGSYFISVSGQPDITYVLQVSEDLFNWVNISTNVTSSGTLRLPDPTGGTNAAAFYRAVAVGP